MSVKLFGVGNDRMVSRNAGCGVTPSDVILKPRKSTEVDANWNLDGLKIHPAIAQVVMN